MLESIVRSWWVFVVRGAFAILFGILAFAWPGATLLALVVLFGAFAFVDGIMSLIASPMLHSHRYRWWIILDGILGILVGVLTFFYPGATALGLLLLLGAWLMLAGVLRIVAAIEFRRHLENEWLIIIGGALTVMAGIVTFIWPGQSALAWVWVIGIYAILFGILMLAVGARLHRLEAKLHPRSAIVR